MLNILEKLINEHGSSSILKERLIQVKEQFDCKEKEVGKLKQQLESLENINKQLLNENIELKSKIQRMDVLSLHEDQVKILGHLFKEPDGIEKEELRELVGLDKGMFSFHIEKLLSNSFLAYPRETDYDPLSGLERKTIYCLSHSGRIYYGEQCVA